MVLYILFCWSGIAAHSQLVFCTHLCVWKSFPDVSMKRDALHVYLLLHHLVLPTFSFWANVLYVISQKFNKSLAKFRTFKYLHTFIQEIHAHVWYRKYIHVWCVSTMLFSLVCVVCSDSQLCPTLCNHLDCRMPGPSVHGTFPARILRGCHFLLQEIFWTLGSNPSPVSPALQQIPYHWDIWEAPAFCYNRQPFNTRI